METEKISCEAPIGVWDFENFRPLRQSAGQAASNCAEISGKILKIICVHDMMTYKIHSFLQAGLLC